VRELVAEDEPPTMNPVETMTEAVRIVSALNITPPPVSYPEA
jgi:hypothetical protein